MFTYPSVYITLPNGATAMVAWEITSVTGLQAWIDYIPVTITQSTTADKRNTFDYDGSINAQLLGSVSGLTAGIDYIKVYQVTSGTPWIDYIPLYDYQAGSAINMLLESGDDFLLEDGSLILLEG
jgi:hypothetical protein